MTAIAVVVAAAAIVLPLSFENGNVYVSGRIADTPLRLIVDTGGKGGLQLTATASRKLPVELKADVVTRTDALGNQYTGSAFEVAELYIGDTVFHGVDGFVRGEAAGGVTRALPADGLLGMEFLRPYVARFDYEKAILTLYADSQLDEGMKACKGKEIPLVRHPLGFWSSEVTTDHGSFRLVWDSGATYSLISAEAARARQLPLVDDLYRTKLFEFGTTDFGPLDLVAIDLHVPEADVLLGYNFFQEHIICFDGPRSTITIAG